MSQSLYHLGRLCTYLFLGLLAGYLGRGLDQTGDFFGWHRIASIVSGVLLIVWGLSALFGSSRRLLPPPVMRGIAALRSILAVHPQHRFWFPFMLGMSSTLLPCGWLYTYVAVAAGTGSPQLGAAVMLFFWLGTVPVLLGVGSLSRFVSAPIKTYAPILTALLVLGAGFFSLFDHFGLTSAMSGAGDQCHSQSPE